MLEVGHKPNFFKKDNSVKEQVKNQIKKILENTEIGKPMRYTRKLPFLPRSLQMSKAVYAEMDVRPWSM